MLKGSQQLPKPSADLTKNQKKIFKFIVDELEVAEILCKLDVFVLERISCCIDIIKQCEKEISENGVIDENGNVSPAFKVRKDEMANFIKLANELSLSPQARAKIANISIKNQNTKDDKLFSILEDREC